MKIERDNPIRAFRRRLGLSQAGFASYLTARLGWQITQTQVSKWETGNRALSRANLRALHEATDGKAVRGYASWLKARAKSGGEGVAHAGS